MATKKSSDVPSPTTLLQAHEFAVQLRPSRAASAETWLAYHRRMAAMYAEVAEIDRGHHHEAVYWVNRERAHATRLSEQMRGKAARAATVHKEQQ
jgi:hypothetical protein